MSDLHGLRLDVLLRELPADSRLSGDGSVRVLGVQQDSRRVSPGDLFVARTGARSDGRAFVDEALASGAVAVLADATAEVPSAVPCVRVSDVRVGLALAAAAVYEHPTFGLDVIGVTGTNGKTTTTHLIRAAIDGALGRDACGVVGTTGHAFGGVRVDAAHTTPEADELARIIKDMRDRGATHVAMEVSSIALVTRRVHAVRFRVAAFTNLTQDHLDFHGTMDAYAAAKAELFTTALPGSAVLHVGDPFGRALASRVKAPTVRVSAVVDASPSEADVAPTALSMSSAGIRCTLRVPGGSVELVSPLFGQHNVENIVVALGVIVALGLDARRAAAALAEEAGAPGRLERCDGPNDDVTVLVDYAHTPDAVSRVLATVRNVVQGRLIAVLGCGGDRDPTKRGPMGTAAARGADIAVITNDNPRGEVPDDIAKAIEVGLSEGGMEKVRLESIRDVRRGFAVELDRSRAIHAAVLSAAPGDTVVVLGKGHEAYQIIGERRSVFDDRVEARAALTLRHAQRSGETAR